MIGTLVTFRYAQNYDRSRLAKIAHDAKGAFRGMPGLRSKFFTLDDAGRQAVNFYVWESRAAAEKFFTPEVRERVTRLYGVPPTITFVDIVETVDNVTPERTAELVGSR